MPPGTQPVPERILDDLISVLGNPDGGSSYFHDVQQVLTPGESEFNVHIAPAVAIFPEGTTDDDTEVYSLQHTRWNLTILGLLKSRPDDINRALLQFVHDIYKAVMTDPSRDGNAIDTKWMGWTPSPPADDADELSWVECRIQVVFRTDDTDMTTAR